jgi:hypothetical protein
MIFAEWGVGQMLWSLVWLTLFFLWIWLVIAVFFDIFRSHDLGGWGKALWCLFIIVLPFLGVFVYLIARGGSMRDRSMAEVQAQETYMRAYIQDAASAPRSPAAEVERLADLHAQGALTDEEFAALKAKTLA